MWQDQPERREGAGRQHRRIRPVGRAYQRLVSQWREVLPTQSLCLQVPVVMPSAFDPEGLPEAYWAMQARRRGQ